MGQGYSDCYYVDLSLAHILDLKNHRYLRFWAVGKIFHAVGGF